MSPTPRFFSSAAVVASPAAAAETVVCAVPAVCSAFGNPQITLHAWLNVTPDADATALTLRLRRRNLTGTLVTPAQTVALGAASGSAVTLGGYADNVSADAPTVIPFDNAQHTVNLIKAAPPSWLSGAGAILEPGLYVAQLIINKSVAATTPGLIFRAVMPFNTDWLIPQDGIDTFLTTEPEDVMALDDTDVPLTMNYTLHTPTDATAALSVLPQIGRLAAAGGGGGGGAGDTGATIEAVDNPGSVPDSVYVLTAQMTAATGPSTVNGAAISARID